MDNDEILKYSLEAIESLKTIKPMKILVFGSAATLNLHKDSDLDFLIVLDNNNIPETYEEKLALKMVLNHRHGVQLSVFHLLDYDQ